MKTSKTDTPVTLFFAAGYLLLFLYTAAFLPHAAYDAASGTLKVVPDLLLCFSIVHGLLDENRRRAAIMALVTGFLCDVFIMPPSHLSPLLFSLGAYFAPFVFRAFTRKNVLSATVSALPFFAARFITGAVFLLSEHRELTLGTALTKALLPEFGKNVLCVIITYLVIHFLFTRFSRKFC